MVSAPHSQYSRVSTRAGLPLTSGRSINETDQHLQANLSAGQDLIDALTSLRLTMPSLDSSLHSRLVTLFPSVILALQSSFSLIRMTAAKCLAALCDIVTEEGMKRLVDDVVPLIGDAGRVQSRQGAIEAVHRTFLIYLWLTKMNELTAQISSKYSRSRHYLTSFS